MESPRNDIQYPSSQEKSKTKSTAFKFAWLSLCACNFISTLDTVIVAAALPAITKSLNATSNEAYWCGSGFLFSAAVSQPLYGAFSEIFGRKICLVIAFLIFTVCSLLCALAQSPTWLIIARVIQGLGAGGNDVLVSVIITDIVPLRERGKYIGFLSLGAAVALISGLIIGSAISERSTWRWIFYINLPVCVPSIVGIVRFIHLQPLEHTFKQKFARIDYGGMIILTGSLISLLYGVTGGGVIQPWGSPRILSPLIIGVIGIGAFLVFETFVPNNPMIPVRIFTNRTSGSALLSAWVLGFVLWAMEYYLLLFFLISKNRSLLTSALDILPGCALVPPAAGIGGYIINRTKRFKALACIAWVLSTVGFACMTTLGVDSNKGMQFGFQILYGIGGGIIFPVRFTAIQAAQAENDVPMATAMVSLMLSIGQAFGVGIGGAIFQNIWDRNISAGLINGSITPRTIITHFQLERAADIIRSFPIPVQVFYRKTTANAVDTLFIVLAAFSALALLGSLGMKNLSLDRDTMSAQRFIETEKRVKQSEKVVEEQHSNNRLEELSLA